MPALRDALCASSGPHDDSGNPIATNSTQARLLAALWRSRPGSPDVPVRLASNVREVLALVAANLAAPRQALLRLLLWGYASPSPPWLPVDFPEGCAPSPPGSSMAPPGARAGCSLDTLVSFTNSRLAAVLNDSPVLGRFHNESDIAEALWAPAPKTHYTHERLKAMADAAAAGDARALSDALYPLRRGRSIPSIATFFNVALLADGIIVSVDDQLRSHSGDGVALDSCKIATLESPEPLAVSRCTNRSEANYLIAAASRAPFTMPTAGGDSAGTDAECSVSGLSDATAAEVVARAIARSSVVAPMMVTGEVAADGRLAHGGRGSPPCVPSDGWSCSVSHSLDRRMETLGRSSPMTMRVSTTFRKDQLSLPHVVTALRLAVPPPSPTGLPSPSPALSVAAMVCEPLPVYDDVLHFDMPYNDNFFSWVVGSAGAISLVRDWLAAFPHAVLHFEAATAVAWKEELHTEVRWANAIPSRGRHCECVRIIR